VSCPWMVFFWGVPVAVRSQVVLSAWVRGMPDWRGGACAGGRAVDGRGPAWRAGYGGAAARLARVVRRRRRVLGGSPAAARWVSRAWRAVQAVMIRWLRTMSRVAVSKVVAVRPMRRHQPREMSLLAGSLAVEKVRSAALRRAYDCRCALEG
jgi:hypothetical protein